MKLTLFQFKKNYKHFLHKNGTALKKSEVFYGQDRPGGESTTTECGVSYQLLSVIYCSSTTANS